MSDIETEKGLNSDLLEQAKNILHKIELSDTTSLPFSMRRLINKDEFTEAELDKLIQGEKKLAKVLSEENYFELCKILTALSKKTEHRTSFKTGFRSRDARAVVYVTPDEMEAYLTIFPRKGSGKKISVQAVYKALEEAGIVYGINESIIGEAVSEVLANSEIIEDVLVAQGLPPEAGDKYRIEYHFKKWKLWEKKAEAEIAIGRVKMGQLILSIIPPSRPGRPGKTITGEEISFSENTKPILMAKQNVNVTDNGLKYYSRIDGLVVLTEKSIKVEPYLDGNFEIRVSDDGMKVFMNISPKIGRGKPNTLHAIVKTLHERDITFGINEFAIKTGIEISRKQSKSLRDIVIAEGIPAATGKNAKIIENNIVKKYIGNKAGSIDYKEIKSYNTVKKGDILLKKQKATKGDFEGFTVYGQKIAPYNGKDIFIDVNENVEIKEDSKNVIYFSKINGHAEFEDNVLKVSPVLIIDGNVDYNTGNIDFDGDVIVKGNIIDNFSAKVQGNLYVMGSVNSADIETNGDLIIKKGIIANNRGNIIVNGNLKAGFIEAANIQVRGDLFVDKTILNSKIMITGSLNCTFDKGQILGGKIQCGRNVEVNILGSEGGIKTELITGIDFVLLKELEFLEKEIRVYKSNLKKVNNVSEKLFSLNSDINKFTPDMKKILIEALRKKNIINQKLGTIELHKMSLMAKIDALNKSYIKVNYTVYTDVKINISNAIIEIKKEPLKCVKFVKDTATNKIRILKRSI